ncbi:MAG: hypothetical protein ACRD0L_11380 [Acidimicrobiales bacterium]
MLARLGDAPYSRVLDAFADHITQALPDAASFTEAIRVAALIGVAH